MKSPSTIILFIAIICISLACTGQNKETVGVNENLQVSRLTDFPLATGWVSDFDSIFTVEEIQEMDSLIASYKEQTSREIAIVSVDSMWGFDSLKDFSQALGNHWGVGSQEKDNGLLILICDPRRDLYIASGSGTELILSDSLINSTIQKTILPAFKERQFGTGTLNGLKELMVHWKE